MHTVNAGSLLLQMEAAAKWEEKMIAKLLEMEKEGIVEHGIQDGWIVLDQKRYYEVMGMYGPEVRNENR